MYYAPHQLQKKVVSETRDEYGRILSVADTWVDVCRCRCDDADSQEIEDDNGKVFTPHYHIVAEGRADIEAGDEARCLNGDGSIRASGVLHRRPKHLNVLQYTDLWL